MDNRTSFLYDPIVQGYTSGTLWKDLTGTVTVSSNELLFNADEAIMLVDVVRGSYFLKVTLPVGPTAGDDRQFGLLSSATGRGIYFDMTDDVFSAVATDGTETVTEVITYDTNWTAASILFNVVWEAGSAKFYADGVKVAETSFIDGPVILGSHPLSVYANNANADAMTIAYVEGTDIYSYLAK